MVNQFRFLLWRCYAPPPKSGARLIFLTAENYHLKSGKLKNLKKQKNAPNAMKNKGFLFLIVERTWNFKKKSFIFYGERPIFTRRSDKSGLLRKVISAILSFRAIIKTADDTRNETKSTKTCIY